MVSLIISILILANREYLVLTKQILSDLPCLFFTILSWIVIDAYVAKRNWKKAIIAGLLCFLSFFARTMGITVLVSLALADVFYFIHLIREKKIREHINIIFLPYVTFILLWLLSKLLFPGTRNTYISYFTFSIEQYTVNARYYFILFWNFLLQGQLNRSPGVKALVMILALPTAAVTVIGIIKRAIEKDHLSFYLIVFMTTLCVYDHRQGTRLIISVYPVLMLFAYYGAKVIIRSGKEKAAALSLGFFCVTGLCCSIIWNLDNAKKPGANYVYSENAIKLYEFIDRELDKASIVYFEKPRVLYLYTGVYSFFRLENISLDDIDKADYVLSARYLQPQKIEDFLSQFPDYLEPVYKNDDFQLYKIVRTE